MISSSSPPQQTAQSSSFVQCLVLTKKTSSNPLIYAIPRKRSKSGTRRSKSTDSNIRGVIPFPQTTTQAAPLRISAHVKNRAHDFYTCSQGPWTLRLAVDDELFWPFHTPHGHCFRTIRAVPSLSVIYDPKLRGTCVGMWWFMWVSCRLKRFRGRQIKRKYTTFSMRARYNRLLTWYCTRL